MVAWEQGSASFTYVYIECVPVMFIVSLTSIRESHCCSRNNFQK